MEPCLMRAYPSAAYDALSSLLQYVTISASGQEQRTEMGAPIASPLDVGIGLDVVLFDTSGSIAFYLLPIDARESLDVTTMVLSV